MTPPKNNKDDNVMLSNSYNDYWKLNDYSQNPKSFVYGKVLDCGYSRAKMTFNKPRLVQMLQRRNRGLLCYDKYSNRVLKKLCDARHITCFLHDAPGLVEGTTVEVGRLATVETLERAGDKLHFRKFLDLPPELRTRVYEYYVAAFDDVLAMPTKPPLSRTCRLMRQEVLPVFYANHDFEIHLIRDNETTSVFRQDLRTQLFLLHLSPADMATITRLSVKVHDKDDTWSPPRPEAQGSCCIELDRHSERYKLTIVANPRSAGSLISWWTQERCSSLKRELSKVVDQVQTVEGRKRFRVEDIYALRTAVEAAHK